MPRMAAILYFDGFYGADEVNSHCCFEAAQKDPSFGSIS